MDLHEFRDTLKKLRFVDRQPWMTNEVWVKFHADPIKSFIRADDETADRIWELIRPTGTAP